MKISERKIIWIIASLWLLSNVLAFLITKDNFYVIISTYSWLFIVTLITIAKRNSNDKKSKNKLVD